MPVPVVGAYRLLLFQVICKDSGVKKDRAELHDGMGAVRRQIRNDFGFASDDDLCLAAPSASVVREQVIARLEAGEQIKPAVVREMLQKQVFMEG